LRFLRPGDVPNPTKILERLCKQSVSDMALPDLLVRFRRMYLATQLAKNIEISLESGNESITIFMISKTRELSVTLLNISQRYSEKMARHSRRPRIQA